MQPYASVSFYAWQYKQVRTGLFCKDTKKAPAIAGTLQDAFIVKRKLLLGKDSDCRIKMLSLRKRNPMKKILTFIRNYRDRRLRERCVKYAVKSKQNDYSISQEAIYLYRFIKGFDC